MTNTRSTIKPISNSRRRQHQDEGSTTTNGSTTKKKKDLSILIPAIIQDETIQSKKFQDANIQNQTRDESSITRSNQSLIQINEREKSSGSNVSTSETISNSNTLESNLTRKTTGHRRSPRLQENQFHITQPRPRTEVNNTIKQHNQVNQQVILTRRAQLTPPQRQITRTSPTLLHRMDMPPL